MAVSQEELLIHGSQVVCPQCLAVCLYENGGLVARDDSDAPYRHTASVEMSKRDNTKFCYSCGKKLPGGISFCPYCGADLNAPFEGGKPHAVNELPPVQSQPEPQPQPQPAAPQHQPAQQQRPAGGATAGSRESTTDHVEDKLRSINHHYTTMRPHLHQHGTKPGRTFKIIAYALIALLLILLACIIIAGASIESPI